MLAELAAANAAFAVIKQCIANGKTIHDAGSAASSYFDNKTKIQRKLNSKGNRSDIEEFFALEKIKEQEKELQQLMIYAGRTGLWDDWLFFQAKAAQERRAEALRIQREERLRREEIAKLAKLYLLGGSIFTCVMAGLFAAMIL